MCGKRNESFCFIYHSVIIEEMCFSPHFEKGKKKHFKDFFFFFNFEKQTPRVKSGARYFCQGLSEGNYLNSGCCEDVCDRLGRQGRLWCSWNTALGPSTVKMMNGWKSLWVTLNGQWQYIRRESVWVDKKFDLSDAKNYICTQLIHLIQCGWQKNALLHTEDFIQDE